MPNCTKCSEEIDKGNFCEKCAASFFRAYNLSEETKDNDKLTGREVVEMECEQEAICANLSIEEITKHINDMKRKLQSFQVKLNTAHRVRAKKEVDAAQTFTPEERAAFERTAKEMGGKVKDSGRVAKAVKTKKAATTRDAAIAALVAAGIDKSVAETMIPQLPVPASVKDTIVKPPPPQPVQSTNTSKGDASVKSMMALGMSEEAARRMLGL